MILLHQNFDYAPFHKVYPPMYRYILEYIILAKIVTNLFFLKQCKVLSESCWIPDGIDFVMARYRWQVKADLGQQEWGKDKEIMKLENY